MLPVSSIAPGMTIELTAEQALLDVTTSDWPTLRPGSRLVVVSIERLATSSSTRQPFALILRSVSGSEIPLEVEDGRTLVGVVEPVRE